MGDVYVEPDRHECRNTGIPRRRNTGSIYQCDECGRYWYASSWETSYADYSWGTQANWRPVRWWHFGLRARIANQRVAERIGNQE